MVSEEEMVEAGNSRIDERLLLLMIHQVTVIMTMGPMKQTGLSGVNPSVPEGSLKSGGK